MTRAASLRRAAALLAALLTGCSGGQEQELQAWLAQQRQTIRPSVKPLSPPKRFEAQPYVGASGADPFGSARLAGAQRPDAAPSSLLAAEMTRRREPLEAYPLDSMTMVGSVARHGRQLALLKVDKLLYQVGVGEHLGQNFGRITRITETEVAVREVVQDASGEWVERPATLQLQEAAR